LAMAIATAQHRPAPPHCRSSPRPIRLPSFALRETGRLVGLVVIASVDFDNAQLQNWRYWRSECPWRSGCSWRSVMPFGKAGTGPLNQGRTEDGTSAVRKRSIWLNRGQNHEGLSLPDTADGRSAPAKTPAAIEIVRHGICETLQRSGLGLPRDVLNPCDFESSYDVACEISCAK
jgi:hypothetical protein